MAEPVDLTVYWDPRFENYRNPDRALTLAPSELFAVQEPHPDRPERIRNIRHLLQHVLAERMSIREAPPADRTQLERVHEPTYIDSVADIDDGETDLSPRTPATPATYETARLAAGAAIATVESAMNHDEVPYALVRPSGHHAQPERADGFCYFNNTAVAAEHARQTELAERIAILDWDAHHGNGIQECFYNRNDVLFISIHNDHRSWDPESHPQDGTLDEVGTGNGEGYTINVPVPFGTGDEGYARAFEQIVAPIFTEFDPDLILVAAGQDAGPRDPLGRNVVTRLGFKDLGQRVRELATELASGRLGIIQEGGYQVTHLALATLGVLEGASGIDTEFEDGPFRSDTDPFAWPDHCENVELATEWIERACRRFDEYWDL